MNREEDIPQNYAVPVHRSLLKRDLTAGVSQQTIMILFLLTLIMVLGFGLIWFIGVSVILYIAARFLTSRDEFRLDILCESIWLPDRLNP